PVGGRHGHHHGFRVVRFRSAYVPSAYVPSACVSSAHVPPSWRVASAPYFVHKKLPPAAPICRDHTSMSELKHVPSLIGDVYEAILDSSVWSGVFENLAQFVGAQAGALLWKRHSRSIDVVHTTGIKSPGLELYKERYAKLDP